MSVEEIMNIQSYNIDLPEYKKAKTITETLINSFELYYGAVSDKENENALKQKDIILAALNSADIIKMDYSMFKEDIDFLKKYDLK